jgi:hypothetical protein
MKHDIAETTQFVRFAVHLAIITEAAKDGGFSIGDAAKFLPLLKEIGPAFAGAKDIPKELRDMDMGEAFQLAGMVQEVTGANMANGHAIRITERSLDVLRALLVLTQTIRGDAASLPSKPREPDAIDRLDAELSQGSETRLPTGELVEVRRATLAPPVPVADGPFGDEGEVLAQRATLPLGETPQVKRPPLPDIRTVILPGQILPVHIGPAPDPLPPPVERKPNALQQGLLGKDIIEG